ncbi:MULTISPECIES: GTP-binding protein [unclassified Marinobacterium]|jgi:G3E family GTPase|uniref:CobW family GTP-binding protein n=1 Tax=unclassified Marinobacterium TaxID=2644139 RepID=UPI0015684F8D|nr:MULTISPECIES: GTP-binding protein [unclassified Marinobacterium]NRP52328.1 putative metal chaperone YciC [Marinobacterium sp. xm-v-242]NRP76909.1 putative metal chaperone YciC [Marinobacterium sp. xm-m-383]
MSKSASTIKAVPTNIITGFLGAGKTSAISHLLQNKPKHERWAVLVNEFGEIGIDGSLMQGQYSEDQGVFIREVPGGCMCCAAGLPMQIALNMLLAKSKPDRLLIEPTGLGHPKEVLEVLSSEHYQEVLSIQKIITLVDARQLHDARYTNHDTFNQQLAIADIVIGNKQDLYAEDDKQRLRCYLSEHFSPTKQLLFTEHGKIDTNLLTGSTNAKAGHAHHHHSGTSVLASDQPLPDTGFLKAENQGDGFLSVGWRFDQHFLFDRSKLYLFLSGLEVERMKAVFITTEGVFGYNLADGSLKELTLSECEESRIEIIAVSLEDQWETQILHCAVNSD